MRQILEKARDQIINYGLAHEAFSNSGLWNPNFSRSPMCLIGAISWAATGNPRNLRDPVARQGWELLQEALSEFSELRLVTWNDEKTYRPDGTWFYGRTIEEVVDLFDRAIAKL